MGTLAEEWRAGNREGYMTKVGNMAGIESMERLRILAVWWYRSIDGLRRYRVIENPC